MEDLLIKRGEFLRNLLKQNNLMVKDFASMLCVSSQAVTHWLNGENEITSDRILDICEILKIKPEELLNGEYNNKIKAPIPYEKEKNIRGIEELSQVELLQVAEAYCNNIPKDRITTMYKFDIGKARLLDVMPPIYLEDKCEYCNIQMVIKIRNKNMFPYCPRCGHEVNDNTKCKCDNCKAKELEAIKQNIKSPMLDLNFDSLKLNEKLMLRMISRDSYYVQNDVFYKSKSYDQFLEIYLDEGYVKISENDDLRKYKVVDGKIRLKYNASFIFKVNFKKDEFDDYYETNEMSIKKSVIDYIKKNLVDLYLEAITENCSSIRVYDISLKPEKVKIIEELFEKYSYAEMSAKFKYILKDCSNKIESKVWTRKFVSNNILNMIINLTHNIENKDMSHFVDDNPICSNSLKLIAYMSELSEEELHNIFNERS